MNWIPLTDIAQIPLLITESEKHPVVIFKHSTRCSISLMAKARLDKEQNPEQLTFYYLDLLNHRDISNAIAQQFHVPHESPQVLLIKKGECLYEESHNGINFQELVAQAQ